ncbi:MAG TPA: tetratricopeptide repeat protein [Solirubrobacteraceae bacterium]
MSSPIAAFRAWRGRRVWHRDPDRALDLLTAAQRSLDGDGLGILAWLALRERRDPARAEQLARDALARGGDTRFASAALAEVLARRGDHDGAIEVLRAASATNPDVRWYALTLADALEAAGRTDEAEALMEESLADPELHRHAIKRLSRIALARGDRKQARARFEALVALAPNYLVYASDYETLGKLQLEVGDREAARSTWHQGAKTYPRHAGLRALREQHFGETDQLAQPRIAPVSEDQVHARRIPVRTEFIDARSGLLEVIGPATAGQRRFGDTVAVAESAAAAGQGRLVPLELIRAGRLAHALSRFVGKIGPLHSAEGMEGAIMEAGRPRVVVGAIAGGLTRPLGLHGAFYRVAGEQAAMIDDVAAALPPHDHHVVFGPHRPDALGARLASELGCEVAIVDANHRTGAWVVGASPGVDREWLQRALADNPAGNEDEQTPVVIVRPTGSQP